MIPDPEVIAELMRLHSSAVIARFKPSAWDEPGEPTEEEEPCDTCRYYREDPRPAYNTRLCQRHTKETQSMADREKGQLVHIFGVVGKDPSIRSTRAGDVIGFSLACSNGYDKADGTTWYDISSFNEGHIRSVAAEVYKGAKVAVEGFLSYRTHNDVQYPQIMAVQIGLVEFLDRTRREGSFVPAGAQAQTAAAAPVPVALPPGMAMAAPQATAPDPDDLPF